MNSTTVEQQYVLRPRPPLITGISDQNLSLIIPVLTHWLTSAVYEIFEYFQLFQAYRIHASEEEKAKNTITRSECLRGVLLVQFLQTGLGVILGAFSEPEMIGDEDRDILLWASRVHRLGRGLLSLSSLSGLKIEAVTAILPRSDYGTGFLASSSPLGQGTELLAAKLIYYGLLPALRLYAALWLADTWVFFIHRAEHSNAWLYKKFHARHHEMYVPFSWGGIYDQPVESMFLSVGAFVVAVLGTGMSLRESMIFSAFSSAKACTDHGGYQFPWNPVDLFTSVGAAYHDKHHQRWGFKTNFALHFQFWDRMLGTEYTDTETATRLYARDRKAAQVAAGTYKDKVKAS